LPASSIAEQTGAHREFKLPLDMSRKLWTLAQTLTENAISSMQTDLSGRKPQDGWHPVGWPFALATGFAVLAGATATQWLLHAVGIRIYFASFLLGVFAAGVLAGRKGAVTVLTLAVPLVWWAFMPPSFEFNPLTPAEVDAMTMFLLLGLLLLFAAESCREFASLSRRDR
jgi:K+-sensing histidine kinase KdpD